MQPLAKLKQNMNPPSESYPLHICMNAIEAKYINECHRAHIFVFAMPRSGSTLLMRLANQAGLCSVNGERPLGFYESLLGIHEQDYESLCQFGRMDDLEKNGVFMDTYAAMKPDSLRSMMAYHIKHLIFSDGTYTGSKFAKITQLGFGNDLVKRFTDMLRQVYEYTWGTCALQIVWLTRDDEEIVHSMQTLDHPSSQSAKEYPVALDLMLKNQRQQFKDAYELGDICLTYSQLLADPQKYLLRMQVSGYPSEDRIAKVMAKKLRS